MATLRLTMLEWGVKHGCDRAGLAEILDQDPEKDRLAMEVFAAYEKWGVAYEAANAAARDQAIPQGKTYQNLIDERLTDENRALMVHPDNGSLYARGGNLAEFGVLLDVDAELQEFDRDSAASLMLNHPSAQVTVDGQVIYLERHQYRAKDEDPITYQLGVRRPEPT